jgi:hypothetical protein
MISTRNMSAQQDGLGASKVDVSRDEIAQALIIATMVIVIDEYVDLGLDVAGQIIVLKQLAVLECLMPALGLALRLPVAGRAVHVTPIAPGRRRAPALVRRATRNGVAKIR